MKYTEEQLKQALAKMLPESVFFNESSGNLNWINATRACGTTVLDTELLHLCWLVEEKLTQNECNVYDREITHSCDNKLGWKFHATWQQRTIALAKVKGIEIV